MGYGPGIESRWGARFSAHVQTGPGAYPASCTMGKGSFQGVKSGRGVTLTTHPLLLPLSINGRAIPLLPLWAVGSVQSLNACTIVRLSHGVSGCSSSINYSSRRNKEGQIGGLCIIYWVGEEHSGL